MNPEIEKQRWVYARVRAWLAQVRRRRAAGLGLGDAQSIVAGSSAITSAAAIDATTAAAIASQAQPLQPYQPGSG